MVEPELVERGPWGWVGHRSWGILDRPCRLKETTQAMHHVKTMSCFGNFKLLDFLSLCHKLIRISLPVVLTAELRHGTHMGWQPRWGRSSALWLTLSPGAPDGHFLVPVRSCTHRQPDTGLLGASLSQRATNNATAKLCRHPGSNTAPCSGKRLWQCWASRLPGSAPGLHRCQPVGGLAILRAWAQACGAYSPGPWRATAVNCRNFT